MSKTITITLSRDGAKSTLQTEGFSGGECLRASEKFRNLLGKVENEEHTAEYYAGDACQAQAFE